MVFAQKILSDDGDKLTFLCCGQEKAAKGEKEKDSSMFELLLTVVATGNAGAALLLVLLLKQLLLLSFLSFGGNEAKNISTLPRLQFGEPDRWRHVPHFFGVSVYEHPGDGGLSRPVQAKHQQAEATLQGADATGAAAAAAAAAQRHCQKPFQFCISQDEFTISSLLPSPSTSSSPPPDSPATRSAP